MGKGSSKAWNPPFPLEGEMRVVIVGLDGAGKSSLMHKLCGDDHKISRTMPTIGWNVKSLSRSAFAFTAWDVGGGDKLYPLWRYYFQQAHALVWMVDSSDPRDRMETSFDWLNAKCLALFTQDHQKVNEACKDDEFPLLLLCNKQDLPGAMNVDEIVTVMGGPPLHQPFLAVGCSVWNDDNVREGMDWLNKSLLELKNRKLPATPVIAS